MKFERLCFFLFLLPIRPTMAQSLDADSSKITNIHEAVKIERKNDPITTPNIGHVSLNYTNLRAVPTLMGEPDLIKALQLQPGVSAGVEGFAGMMVRGGNNDENMFLIDGNPVYQMNHLGGLFSAYNVEAVRGVEFYKGAFPARYGGRLSSVVDITTRTGDLEKIHLNLSVGLTSLKAAASGPIVKGRTTFAVAVRRSWLELVTIPALAIYNRNNKSSGEKTVAGYNFTDFNLKISHNLKSLGTLSLTGYYGYDHLKTGSHQFSTDKDEEGSYYYHIGENRLGWGNALAALQWHLPIGEAVTAWLNASYTRYNSVNKKKNETTWGRPVEEGYEHTLYKPQTTNGISDWTLKSAFKYAPDKRFSLGWGADYIRHCFTPEKETDNTYAYTQNASHVFADEASAYIESTWTPLNLLSVEAGIRGSLFHEHNGTTHTIAEPRLVIDFVCSPLLSVKAGYSRMSQMVQQVSDNYISLPTDFWMPISGNLKPLISDQISAGVYFKANENYSFSVEGYYKKMQHLLEYREGYNLMPTSTPWYEKLTEGSGRAYGMDLQIEKSHGRVTGFIGYGLLWSDRLFPQLNNDKRFPSKYDNRHKFNISLTYHISPKMELNAAWTYMTGNRITLALENYAYPEGLPTDIVPPYPNKDEEMLNYYNGKNNVRLPAYHRLDLGLNIYKPLKKKRMSIWNISLYNAYSRMNPIMIEKNNDRQTMGGQSLQPRFRKFSLFPVIPSFSYTYKF